MSFLAYLYQLYNDKLFEFSYKQSETLFKILHDKYFRPDVYKQINEAGIQNIRQNRIKFNEILLGNIKWMGYSRIKEMKIADDKSREDAMTEELDIENKSLEYIKSNLKGVLNQNISMTLTMCLFIGFGFTFPFKRFRRNTYLYGTFLFSAFNILIYNFAILITINDLNRGRRKFLDMIYKRQIEKYDNILQV